MLRYQKVQLLQNAKVLLEVSCQAKAGEMVVILSNQPHDRYARGICEAADKLGLHPMIMDLGEYPCTRDIYHLYPDSPPLPPVRAALEAADIVINIPSFSYDRLIGRNDNDDSYLTAGKRWVSLQSNGMEHWHLKAEDVAAIRTHTTWLLGVLEGAEWGHVTAPAGTDFHFRLGPNSSHVPVLGIVPLYGEVAVVPGGEEHGVFVIDGPTQMSVRPVNEMLREPLRIEVEGGHVKGYSGDREQVARLAEFMDSGTPRADCIDEVGLTTTHVPENDVVGLGGWADGTHNGHRIHIAIGNNVGRQAVVHGSRHMDGEVDRPTVTIDGRVTMQDGIFVGPQ
jgi:leucyl aminopeptidase (aminopeptidase T)